MNEEQALLAAVRADPNDNTVRLVFADWLDEHDQPERAAWVRDLEIFWWMGPDYVSPLQQIVAQLRLDNSIERDMAGPVVERLRGAAFSLPDRPPAASSAHGAICAVQILPAGKFLPRGVSKKFRPFRSDQVARGLRRLPSGKTPPVVE